MFSIYFWCKIGEKSLIFGLKLDEVKKVHAQKLKCVSLTLMYKTINLFIFKGSPQHFSAQCKCEIWLVDCFQVEKESHAILK